jgi:hypothetical protein
MFFQFTNMLAKIEIFPFFCHQQKMFIFAPSIKSILLFIVIDNE